MKNDSGKVKNTESGDDHLVLMVSHVLQNEKKVTEFCDEKNRNAAQKDTKNFGVFWNGFWGHRGLRYWSRYLEGHEHL